MADKYLKKNISKEREIELLEELLMNDTYLSQAISNTDLPIMVQNIKNDFYILNDTLLGKYIIKDS